MFYFILMRLYKVLSNEQAFQSIYIDSGAKKWQDRIVFHNPVFDSEPPCIAILKSLRLSDKHGAAISGSFEALQAFRDHLNEADAEQEYGKIESDGELLDLVLNAAQKFGLNIVYSQASKAVNQAGAAMASINIKNLSRLDVPKEYTQKQGSLYLGVAIDMSGDEYKKFMNGGPVKCKEFEEWYKDYATAEKEVLKLDANVKFILKYKPSIDEVLLDVELLNKDLELPDECAKRSVILKNPKYTRKNVITILSKPRTTVKSSVGTLGGMKGFHIEAGLSPILYHLTSLAKASAILKENQFKLTNALGTAGNAINLDEGWDDVERGEHVDPTACAAPIQSTSSYFEHLSLNDIEKLRPEIAKAAQIPYDNWDQDENGEDPELGYGGICHLIVDEVIHVLSKHGIDCTSLSLDSEVHVVALAKVKDGVVEIDIPYHLYEYGGGYTWIKKHGVKFKPSDININVINADPEVFEQHVEGSIVEAISHDLDMFISSAGKCFYSVEYLMSKEADDSWKDEKEYLKSEGIKTTRLEWAKDQEELHLNDGHMADWTTGGTKHLIIYNPKKILVLEKEPVARAVANTPDLKSLVEQLKGSLESKFNVKLTIFYRKSPEPSLMISGIVVPKGERGVGIGSKVMQSLSNFCDDHGLVGLLTPSKDFGASLARLRKFYGGFGFTRNRDLRFSEAMMRRPKVKSIRASVNSVSMEDLNSVGEELIDQVGLFPEPWDYANLYNDEDADKTAAELFPITLDIPIKQIDKGLMGLHY